METKGLSRTELIIMVAGLLVLAGLLLFAVLDTQRRSRDTSRVSIVRQIESDLYAYRSLNASFPESLVEMYAGVGIPGYDYVSLPTGCRPDGATLCTSYVVSFELEGRTGNLAGGACEASPEGITCVKR